MVKKAYVNGECSWTGGLRLVSEGGGVSLFPPRAWLLGGLSRSRVSPSTASGSINEPFRPRATRGNLWFQMLENAETRVQGTGLGQVCVRRGSRVPVLRGRGTKKWMAAVVVVLDATTVWTNSRATLCDRNGMAPTCDAKCKSSIKVLKWPKELASADTYCVLLPDDSVPAAPQPYRDNRLRA
jgi:hypothetical protein